MFKISWKLCLFVCIACCVTLSASSQIVINELYYNPPDDGLEDGGQREFVELYNHGDEVIDLSGYYFDDGIEFTFPDGARLHPGFYLVIVKNSSSRYWRNIDYPFHGPYEGNLRDSGEQVTLKNVNHEIVDTVNYHDTFPWPLGADGYGASLERIHPELPSNDYHSWRSSYTNEGTPGRRNSVHEIPAYPIILDSRIEPEHPTSNDSVKVQITLDAVISIESVELRYENTDQSSNERNLNSVFMDNIASGNDLVTYEATVPPMESQNLIRCNIEITFSDGKQTLLPHTAEPNPFITYFVYDGEIESTLPIFWILPQQSSLLLDVSKEISGVVCLQNGQSNPDVFDGAILIPSASNREKVRFLKSQEFYGDRTINIIPEIPTGGTNAGISSPYREHLGFWLYQEMDVPSPWSEFYRIIRLPIRDNTIHRQQLINQQVNERFLEMNDRDPDADLYKLQYTNPNWEKHTNKDEGTDTIDFLLMDIQTSDIEKRRQVMEEQMVLEEFLSYSAASIFVSNWDGYWNNNWMYLDPTTKRWEIIPWDLDWVWGATPPPNEGPMYWQMPLSFPIDGVAVGNTRVSRAPGPITAPMHEDPIFYEKYLNKLAQTINTVFTEDKLYPKIESDREMLLDDLELIEQQTGRFINLRRSEIEESYDTIKLYIQRRRDFLMPLLPTKIHDWEHH